MTMKILGVIPARRGSKGVPDKNTRPLAGKSLIERAYRCAVEAEVLDRILLSSDDPAAAEIARRIGLEVPFLRPADLAGDDTAMIDVVIHALGILRSGGYAPDAVLLLQPTSPLRRPEHIQRAVELLGGFDSVCSVVPLPKTLCPHYVMRIQGDGLLESFLPDGPRYTRRQDVPQAYVREGTVYLTKVPVLLSRRSFYGDRCCPLIIDENESLSIDTESDWLAACRRIEASWERGTEVILR